MPRKKKEQETTEFVPSKYQQAIFDFVRSGNGNVVVEAAAGSGKSTTAIKCLELMGEDDRILLTAFNTDIVAELEKKIKDLPNRSNIDCRTMHSLGYQILMSNYHGTIDRKPNDFKYSGYIYNNIDILSEGFYKTLPKKDKAKYIDNIKKYTDFGRYYLISDAKGLDFIEEHYHVPTYYNEKEIAIKVMEWGMEHIETIDFTDMIWLPNVLNCKPYGKIFDWIVCDECQDTMTAERELLLMCTKMSTRMIFFGEKIQSIYSFMGSDFASFDELRKLPNTISLPLSISYRCPKNVVKFANRFNRWMEPKPGAKDGEVKFKCQISDINDGDMVLCRVNAPLLQMYCELIKVGKTAYIRGKDIGSSLIKVIDRTKEKNLSPKLDKEGVFPKLYDKLFDEIDTVMKKNHISFEMTLEDMNIAQEYDTIQALEAISSDLSTAEELKERIKSLFSDKKKKGVQLSTIHKAKGLEADNVFICCPSLLPSRSAKEPWELQQEANLEYVAYTRAKNTLGFLDEKDFTMYSSSSQQKASDLDIKKTRVFRIYGNPNRCGTVIPTHEAAMRIISSSTGTTRTPTRMITLGSDNIKEYNSISDYKRRKVNKKIRKF
jgi:DNA helicase-2/ATP-dependent DNA helicase PcrA